MSDHDDIFDDEREPVWRLAQPDAGLDPWSSSLQTLERPAPPPPPPAPPLSLDRRSPIVMTFMAALIGAVIGAGTTLVATHNNTGGVVKVAPPVRVTGGAESVAAVAKAVMPSIVRIDVNAAGPFGESQHGTGSGVIYRSDRGQSGQPRKFVHMFGQPPQLACDVDGRQLFVLGGNFQVTRRGLEG